MKLTVLGNAGSYLAPLAGGSSYLLETEGARILLDAGGGARSALAAMEERPIDAVWISHFHFDHVMDLVALRGALGERAQVIIPAGERPRLDALAAAYAFEGPFDLAPVVEVEEDARLAVGDATLRFARTRHSAPSMALRVEADAGALVYASDTAPCAPLQRLAEDADLLLMHALLPTVEPESRHAQVHATAQSAAGLAVAARAKRLLLSHRYHESPDAAMREAASAHADVALAREGASYQVA